MVSAVFRIAHVSDLHLAKRPGEVGLDLEGPLHQILFGIGIGAFKRSYRPWMATYNLSHLRALTRALAGRSYYNKQPYDAYIFSGDMATTGYPQDMAVAAAYMQGEQVLGAESIGPRHVLPPGATVILPGNHDRYFGRWLVPKSAEFESASNFGATWRQFSNFHVDERSIVNSSVLAKGDVRLGVVCADFSYRGDAYPLSGLRYLGRGHAEPRVVKELVAETERLKSEGLPVIWAMHYPPVFGPPVRRRLMMSNSERIGNAAISVGVNTIFCGHTHIPNANLQAVTSSGDFSGVRVICAASATQAGSGVRSYYNVDLEVDADRKTPVRIMKVTEMVYRKLEIRERQNKYAFDADYCPEV